MADLTIAKDAFVAAGKALTTAGAAVHTVRDLPDGDFGSDYFNFRASETVPAWTKGIAALAEVLHSDGAQVSEAGAEFTRVDNALAGKFGG